MRNRNFSQRCGVPLSTKQNIHTHIVLILFLWDIRGFFFNAITGGNSNWVKFTCKVTWPRQCYLISFFKKFLSEYDLDFNIGQTEHDIKMGA